MLDERNDENNIEEEEIPFREISKQVYKIMVDERKEYENNKVKYGINRIYRKCGLKKLESYKNFITKDISLIEIEKLINEMNDFNYENEKNENLYKLNLKFAMTKNFKFIDLETERVKEKFENLVKNEFIIPKFKYKKDIAKYIRKLYREYKRLRTSHLKLLITENFKNFEEIKKVKLNRNGIVLCYNEVNKIVCVYFFFLIDNYINYLIHIFKSYYYSLDDFNSRLFEDILSEKEYQDYMGGRREKKIIEENI